MSETIERFSECAKEFGFDEVWVPLDREKNLLVVQDGDISGVELFAALEDLDGPVADALAQEGLAAVPFAVEDLEAFLEQVDPEESIAFYAITSSEGCLMIPRTLEGARYIDGVRIEDDYAEIAEEGLSGLATLDKTVHSC